MSSGLCSCVFVAGGRLTTHRMTSSSSPPGRFRRSASVSTTIPSFEGRAGSAGRASGAGKVTLVGFCGAGSGTRRWFFGLASHKGRPQRPHTHSLSLSHTHTHTHSQTLTHSRAEEAAKWQVPAWTNEEAVQSNNGNPAQEKPIVARVHEQQGGERKRQGAVSGLKAEYGEWNHAR